MINTETCNSRVLDEASKVIDHEKRGLYDPRYEHDNCGIGSIVNIKGNKTHDTVSGALDIVEKLEHRAGKDAEGKTGDGVGILLQISHKFFKKAVKPLGFELGDERDYGIGMFFFPQDELKRNRAKKMFEVIIEKEGLELLGWRKVPTEPEILGHKALECMPYIMQAFVQRPEEVEKGLDIVRTCRDRYDGRVRNPFNEYECGAWYARAMSSYAMLQALTGIQYDAVDSTLYIDSRMGDDFTSFLSTETGFGNVGLKDGKPFIEVKYGKIDVKKCFVSDIETDFVN